MAENLGGEADAKRLIGWIGRTGTEVIRHADPSAKGHRPFYPATLDQKKTRSFGILEPAKSAPVPSFAPGTPVFFRIKSKGGLELAADIRVLSPQECREHKVEKLEY